MWIPVAVLAVSAVVMVLAMVQLMLALVAVTPSTAARTWWGALYATAWIAIVWSLSKFEATGGGSAWPAALLAASAWIGFNAVWLWLWIRISGAPGQDAKGPVLPPDAPALARGAQITAAVAGLGLLTALWLLGAPQYVIGLSRRSGPAAIAVAVAAIGVLAFIGGTISIAAGGPSRPMTREEVEEMQRDIAYGQSTAIRRRSNVRLHGPVRGAATEQTFTFSAMADAWRSGMWRTDRAWRGRFLMIGGAAAAVIGALAATLMLGSLMTRVVILAVLGYGGVMAIRSRE